MNNSMLYTLFFLLVAGIIVDFISMNAALKNVAYLIIGVAAVLVLLPLVLHIY